MTVTDIILLLLPSFVGYAMSTTCPIGTDAGAVVKFRPPSVSFKYIWAILFVMLGISFVVASHNTENSTLTTVLYLFLIAALAKWIYFYGCLNNKLVSCWILVGILAIELMCFIQGNQTSQLLLAPLMAWSVFALIMNCCEVQNST